MLKIENNIIRLDKLNTNDILGGKSYVLFEALKNSKGIATCGSRISTQIKISTLVCEKLKIPCHIFMPNGKSEIKDFIEKHNAIIHLIKPGYNSVINARAREFAKENNLDFIPLGMLNDKYINIISNLVIENKEIFENIERLVIPIGSGCFFIGIVKGLDKINYKGKILGVMCGMDAKDKIDNYLFLTFRDNIEIIKSKFPYEYNVKNNLDLNENYEAKCLEHMKENDVLISIAN